MTTITNNEECWVLTGKVRKWYWSTKYDRYTAGLPAQVSFDPDYVFDLEDKGQKILGWIHTHPRWTADPSDTDDKTMKAWTCALGRPLLCCILGTDGLRAHWYLNDEVPSVEVKAFRLGKSIYGKIPHGYSKIRS